MDVCQDNIILWFCDMKLSGSESIQFIQVCKLVEIRIRTNQIKSVKQHLESAYDSIQIVCFWGWKMRI